MTKVRIYQSRKSGGKSLNPKTLSGIFVTVKGNEKTRLSNAIVRDSITGEVLKAGSIRDIAKRAVESGMVTVAPTGVKGKTVVVKQTGKRMPRTARADFARLSPEELVEREYQRNKLLMDILAK